MRLSRSILVLAALHLVPAVAWAAFKPLRVIAPQLVGLTCTADQICIDDVSRMAEARALRDEAVVFVNTRIGQIERTPRTVFCSGATCAKSYGFSHQGAYNVGTFGMVIGPRGWHEHFVRHELIHHLQNERLGSFTNWFFKPNWLLEGMAYSLSEDPRRPLPHPLEGWREQFESWYPAIPHEALWLHASRL